MKKALSFSDFQMFIFFLFFLVISIMMFLDGIDRELLVCQRGKKVLNNCEIYRLVPWQKTSIKQFPLSYLKEAVVKEPQWWFHSEDTLICFLVTEEGELPFGSRFGGDEQEKHQWASEINIFLKNKGQLNLSIQESFDFSLFFVSIPLLIFHLFVACKFIFSLNLLWRKKHLFRSQDKRFLNGQKLAQILVITAINKNTNLCNSNNNGVPPKFTVLSKSPTLIIQFPSSYNIFGTTEFQALNESLVIKYKLFLGITEGFSIPRNSLLRFEQCRVFDPASEQLTWKLQAITNHSKIKLIYDGFEKNCSWLGVTLADFYQIEFRQNPNEEID